MKRVRQILLPLLTILSFLTALMLAGAIEATGNEALMLYAGIALGILSLCTLAMR